MNTPPSYPPAPAPALTLRLGAVFAFLPDGQRLVVSGTGPTSVARMVSAATGRELFTLDKPPPNVRGAAVSDDGAVFALAAIRDRVVLYDGQTGGRMHALKAGNDGELSGLEFAPGVRALLHSSWSGLTALDVSQSPAARPLRVSAAYPDNTMYYAVAFSPSGDRFAAAWFDHTRRNNVSLYEWPSGREIRTLACGGNEHPNQILFTPDSQSLVLRLTEGPVTMGNLAAWVPPDPKTAWIPRSAVLPATARSLAGYFGCLGFSPDGTLLAHALSGLLGLWAWPSGECLGKWSLPGRDPMVKKLAFSPGGGEVAVSLYSSRSLFLYRLADLLKRY